MKNGYKHKTAAFGTDAERYAASLFRMVRSKNGHRRPDLISPPNHYDPRLSIEMKSGRNQKGILVRYQLHYAITCEQDYRDAFGEEVPIIVDPTLLPGLPTPELLPKRTPVAYYYNVIGRDTTVKSDMIDRPFAAIQLSYQDQCLVPAEYGFWAFAVARHMRTGETLSAIHDDLREEMKKNVVEQKSNYKNNKDTQSWQNIHGRDVKAIWHNDLSYTTKVGALRTTLLSQHYPNLKNLKPIMIPGPKHTRIYVLAEPEHENLFERQVRDKIQQRLSVMDRVANARVQAQGLLKKVKTNGALELFANGGVPPSHHSLSNLKRNEISRLERLSHWLGPGELPITESDHIPI